MPTTTIRHWHTLGEVRRAHTGHWFDRDTMRFFGCRLPDDGSRLIGGRYFISSEAQPAVPGFHGAGPRLYTIREVMSDGGIETVGEFQGYATRREAERAARELPTDHSAHLAEVLASDSHNRRDWIKRGSQLARYCGAPLEDARATIAARARQRRRAKSAA
jgi:hypothetical protein